MEEYEQHRSSWTVNIFSWKQKNADIKLDPFNRSCVGIDTVEPYKVYLNIIRKYIHINNPVFELLWYPGVPKEPPQQRQPLLTVRGITQPVIKISQLQLGTIVSHALNTFWS